MRLVFAGTSEFAVPALEALAAAGHELALVLTQPDRPAGRGRRPRPSPLHEAAAAAGLPVATPARLDAAVETRVRALAAEALVVAAYGLLIPAPILALPRHGALNIHPSLLPRWRGAAPVVRALLAGDDVTGVAIMRMEAGLDTGPLYRVERVRVDPLETAGELGARLAQRGAQLLTGVLAELAAGRARAEPQRGIASYAARVSVAEARLDFHAGAEELARRVRAFNPRPMAWANLAGERLRIVRALALAQTDRATPGRILAAGDGGIDVASGRGLLRIVELQRPGKRIQPAAALARGRHWPGLVFD